MVKFRPPDPPRLGDFGAGDTRRWSIVDTFIGSLKEATRRTLHSSRSEDKLAQINNRRAPSSTQDVDHRRTFQRRQR